MLAWLTAVCIFWMATAIYLGGMRVDLQGGSGLRQILGLVDMLVLYLVVWGVLHSLLGDFAGLLGSVVIPSVAAVVALPIIARVAFRIMGVRIVHVEGH